jgi:hypothetical protein
MRWTTFGSSTDYWLKYEKDTAIAGNTYQMFIDSSGLVGPHFFIREDTLGKKVYRYENSVDELIMDFGLSVADPVQLTDGNDYAVSIIDSIPISGGQYRKRYYLNFWAGGVVIRSQIWIQGVGIEGHPFSPPTDLPADPVHQVLCSYQRHLDVYNMGIVNGCTATNCPGSPVEPPPSYLEDDPNNIDLRIYANPSQGQVCISRDELSDTNFSLLDIQSRVTLMGSLERGETCLDLKGLEEGTYFLMIGNHPPKKLVLR